MDFTQHNKINTCFPNQNRVVDSRPQPKGFNMPQYSKYTAPPSYASYQSQQHGFRNPTIQQHGDGSDKVSGMSKCYQPYTFNAPPMNSCMAPQKNSYYDDPMLMKSHDYKSIGGEDQMATMPVDNDDLNIEFYQCTPPKVRSIPTQGKTTNINIDPFRPVLESLRHFTDSEIPESKTKPTFENHQTYFFSHNSEDANTNREDENDEETVNLENSYKSRTKIIKIPNGVRIVTEIVKNDSECGNEVFRNFRQLSKHEKWINKSKMIIGDSEKQQVESSNRQNDDIDENCIENETEDHFYKGSNSLINL